MGLFNLPTPNRYRATKACMEWYDYNKRRRPLDGLRLFQRCERGRILLASRHWTGSITWSWLVDLRWRNVGHWWKPRAWWWLSRHSGGGGGQGHITPWIGFAWQPEMPHIPKNYRAERAFIESLSSSEVGGKEAK